MGVGGRTDGFPVLFSQKTNIQGVFKAKFGKWISLYDQNLSFLRNPLKRILAVSMHFSNKKCLRIKKSG